MADLPLPNTTEAPIPEVEAGTLDGFDSTDFFTRVPLDGNLIIAQRIFAR